MASSRSLPIPWRPDRWIPRPAPGRPGALCDKPFAHRGLHGHDRTENGRGAFAEAIAAGRGIECDVQAAEGGRAVVIHDARLDRLTGREGAVAHLSTGELALLRLPDGSVIPTLDELLALVAGRVPLLIEVKMPGPFDPRLCESVAGSLAGYGGPVGAMSFDPRVGRWFAGHAPDVARGLVASNEGRRGRWVALRHLAAIRMARPDFLAWDVRDLPDPVPAAARRRGLAVFTWTVRTPGDRARARRHADQPIFEEVE